MLHLLNSRFLAIDDSTLNVFIDAYLAGRELPKREIQKTPTEFVAATMTNTLSARELGYMGVSTAEASDGLIAVVSVRGASYYYTDEYNYGTEDMIQQIRLADGNAQVKAIVLKVDSQGGELNGSQEFAEAIAACEKPVIGFGRGIVASAAYWGFSQCKECYIQDSLTSVGSIGTMGIYRDKSEQLAKDGLKYVILRSEGSPEKNPLNGYESFAGDYQQKALNRDQQVLTESRQIFLNQVRAKRPRVSASIGGEIFYGKEAIAQGLVDNFMSFDNVLKRANVLGTLARKG